MAGQYVDRGGELVFRQPYVMKGVKLNAFFLDADYAALQRTCDKYLNEPAEGNVRYVVAAPFVMLTLADIASITSSDPVDRNIGWMPEVDVAFWVPLIGLKRIAGLWLPDRFRWFNPYLFVDNAYAMAAGREVYGFHKAMGTFTLPSDFRAPDRLTVDTVGFERFAPTAEGKPYRLLAVERIADAPPGTPETVWTNLNEAADAVANLFTGGSGSLTLPGFADAIPLPAFLQPQVSIAFLKQFRDVAQPRQACYQSIAEAPATVTEFRGGGLSLGDYQLTIAQLDSHPVAQELGLQAGPQPVRLSAWVDYDFNMETGRELWRTQNPPVRRKIAVLGGGVGALSAVWSLTSEPDWKDKYEITVFQMGWRLGGKGASGRNPQFGERIEEHGLHIWLGFYDNAFRVMREAYAEWGREPGKPLATWRDAFKEHNFITLEEKVGDRWFHWNFNFPNNDELPGDGDLLPEPWDYVQMLLEWMIEALQGSSYPVVDPVPASSSGLWDLPGLNAIRDFAEDFATTVINAGSTALLYGALRLAKAISGEPGAQRFLVLQLLDGFIDWLWRLIEDEVEQNEEARRLWILMDMGYTMIRGMIDDEVVLRGFDHIDRWDFIEWLRRHDASELTLRSAPIRGVYDLVFGYESGDTDRPNLAAGTALRGCLRMAFTYKGAIFWKMQAGMGDVVFTPLYEVLKRRGVNFQFFHKVKQLKLSADKRSIDSIVLGRQATLKNATYEPLVDVKDLPCWPSHPLYDQLVEGPQLQAHGINLESAWTPWTDVEEITLWQEEDFDDVILGISLAALPEICGELVSARQDWANMLHQVKTVQTLAVQLWFHPDTEELGWKYPRTVLDAYAQPLNTWADMSNLIVREAWPAGAEPKNIAYHCGPFQDAPVIPPYSDHGFPQRELDRLQEVARAWFEKYTGHLWPKAVNPETPALDYAKLIDPAGGTGLDRFRAQYFRVNIDPTERYVLSVKGSTKYRLPADESGFDNLFLAGDWTKTGINAGCVEAAVMSGLRAASGITGRKVRILGE